MLAAHAQQSIGCGESGESSTKYLSQTKLERHILRRHKTGLCNPGNETYLLTNGEGQFAVSMPD